MIRALVAVALLLTTAAAPVARSVLDGADPDAEFIDGKMWIFPTGRRSDRLVAWASDDRVHWRQQGVLITQHDIPWIKADHAPLHDLWAPDMVRTGDHWLLYYAVGPQDPTPSRLGVASCAAPQGPCADSGTPLLTGGDGFEAIDPAVFTDPHSGVRYLYAGGSAGARLRVFELQPDGLGIAREVPVDQPPYFTEGAFMHERNGVYYLSYSHGHWDRADYQVHYATAATPTGPWQYRGVLLSAEGPFKGPGHHSFVQDPATGEWLIVYHRWEYQPGDGPYKGQRRTVIQPIAYLPDGGIAPVHMVEDQ